ncbi:MAG TPA: cohesin domain-containing protein [Terracidiphilus sp.]|jgi:general secretion pathway protein D
MKRAGFPAAPRSAFWIALFSILFLAAVSPLCAQTQTEYTGSVKKLMKLGQAAEQREDWDTAYNAYKAAAAKNFKDIRARTAMYGVRPQASGLHMQKGRQLLGQGDDEGALTEFMRAQEIDPANEAAGQEIASIRKRENQPLQAPAVSPQQLQQEQELNSLGSPVQLKPVSNEPLTLHMGQDSKVVYQAIGEAAGINVLFDPDFNSKRIQVDLQNSTLMDALRIVGVLSNTFWRPITPNTIFVAQNTRSKRTELDEQAVQTFYLTNAWQQNDLNDVQTALRNVLTNIKVYGLASQNALVVRGTPDELLLAQKLINDLDKARPEVVVDVAVMEVSKNWERNLGLQWPSSAGVTLQSSSASSTTTCPTGSTTCTPTTTGTTSTSPTFYDLAHLNANNFGVTIGTATANLLLTDSNTRILQNPRLRATDMQKASLKVGEKIPYATGSFSSGIGGVGGASSLGGYPSAETQFQFIDVGVNIEITPTVHWDRDVTLKMKIEVTAQAGSSTISGVTEPIIAQKTTEETVRLREGEVNILSGVLNQQDQVSWSGIPGLSSIPILKYLFGAKDHTVSNDEVVFLMVPHIVRGQDVNPTNLRPIDTGTGQNVELRRLAVDGPGAHSPAQVQPVTSESIAPRILPPGVATLPGQSASAAAPAALDQLRSAAGGNTTPVPQTNLQVKEPDKTESGEPPVGPPGTPPPPQAGAPISPVSPAATQPAPAGAQPMNPTPNPAGAPPQNAAPIPTPNGAPGNPAAQGLNPGDKIKYMLSPPGPIANGATFQLPVVISNASDISSVPLQIQYDPATLSLTNVGPGDFLSRDGQAVALVHRDDGPGTITVNASRPPGAPGISGAGVVCMLTFQAKAAGPTMVVITKPGAISSSQKPVPALGAQVSLTVK